MSDKVLSIIIPAVMITVILVTGIMMIVKSDIKTFDKSVSITMLASEINEGKVEKILIKNNDLRIFMKDQSVQKSTKENAISVLETLRSLGVNESQLNSLPIEIQERSSWQLIKDIIIPFVLPFFIIAVLVVGIAKIVGNSVKSK